MREKLWDPDNPPVECDAGEVMELWVEDLLMATPLVDHEQAWMIMDEFGKDIRDFGTQLWTSTEFNEKDKPKLPVIPVAYIGIADRQYVTMTGRDELLDLKTAKKTKGSIVQFLETIQYNLTTLFMSRYRAYLRKGSTNAQSQSDQSNTSS